MPLRLTIFFFLVLTLPLYSASLSDPQVDGYNVRVGTQTFGPRYKFTGNSKLWETAEAIRAMDSDVIKFYLGKGFSGQYGITLSGAITNLVSLARDEPSCRHVFDMPFRHIMTWVYTFASNANDAWWKDGYSATERQKEYDEIYAFTQYLLTNYNNSGKSFYFGHWEGDWYLLNGYDTTVNPSPTAIQGMIDWLNNRQKAVDDAMQNTPHTNVAVYNYAEANRVRDAMVNGATNNQRLVNMVLPYVTNLDFVSWSSYDGMNLGASDLTATLDYLEAHLSTNKAAVIPGKRVFVGEYGWGGTLDSAAQESPTRTYVQKLINWGTPFNLFWEMYDNEGLSYWLIDTNNVKTSCYYLHKWFLNNARMEVARFKERNARLPSSSEFAAFASPLLDAPLVTPTNLVVVSNGKLTALTATNALVNGSVRQGYYGSEDASLWIYWGRQDGGTNAANWEQCTFAGVNGSFIGTNISVLLTNLVPQTNYYFRGFASNALGTAWAAAASQFSTDVIDPAAYGNRTKILLRGYNRGSSLQSYPLLVTLGTNLPGFSYKQFGSRTGSDLRFTDETGTQPIAFEIDEWNTNGSSFVWVKIPSLETSNDFIWAYWGNPLATNLPTSSTNGAVWSQDYEIVWHLKENAFPVADSTKRHPTSTGTLPTSTPIGAIGKGMLFNGSSQYLSAGPISLGERFTLSAWVRVDVTANTIETIWANKAGGSATPGFALFANSYASHDGKLILETGNGSVAAYGATDTNLVTLGEWKYVATTIDRTAGKARMYVDGVDQTATTDIRSDLENAAVLMLGRFTNTPVSSAFPFKGTMDEVRVEKAVRSTDWLWTTWMSTVSNSAFLGFTNSIQQIPWLAVSAAGSSLSLAWPSYGVGFSLQTATNLNPPVTWTALTNQPILVSDQWQVALPAGALAPVFFRLSGA